MIPVYDRVHPLRKPKGFEPVVQRWSVGFPNKCQAMCVSFYGVQGPERGTVYRSQFFDWLRRTQDLSSAPTVVDHAAFSDANGLYTHIAALYWIDTEQRDGWTANPHVGDWWNSAARLDEGVGYFKESLTIPLERQETLYWQDYPAGLSRSPEVAVYPTPYCGYYGAMRDRLPLAAVDPLLSELAARRDPVCPDRARVGACRPQTILRLSARRPFGGAAIRGRPRITCATCGHRSNTAWRIFATIPPTRGAVHCVFSKRATPPARRSWRRMRSAISCLSIISRTGRSGIRPMTRFFRLQSRATESTALPISYAPGTKSSCCQRKVR
jgi:hypothetical protein